VKTVHRRPSTWPPTPVDLAPLRANPFLPVLIEEAASDKLSWRNHCVLLHWALVSALEG
jgi:hypothetical protein